MSPRHRLTPGTVIGVVVVTLIAVGALLGPAPADCKSTLDATCEVLP